MRARCEESMPTADNARDPFDLIGTTIEGKYRVASVIGDGGFGVVYRGVHTGFGELIAIKCLKIPANLDEKHRGELLEGLREEGRLLHKLSKATPGIVQALDVGAMTTAAGVWVPYLVLEWLDGETLAELQKRRENEGLGGMPLAEAVELLTPAARALAVAHQNKIAHRDVKPANLFVTKVGEKRTVKVLDFGIAKVLTDTTITEALAHTRVGPSAFTPRYGAPEQFNKQRGATGPWTDVFALALILVELTTGRRALDGDDPTQLYVASADPTLRPTFRGRGLDVPEPVETVINKALHVEPKYRYPDAGEMWDALTAAVGVAPDVVRSSQAAISSGKTKVSDSARTSKPADSDNLATAEFAAQESIAVKTEGPMSGPAEPHAATKPMESLKKAEPPQVVVSKGAGPLVTSASTQVAAAAKEPPAPSRGRSAEDPMAETPPIARLPRAVVKPPEPGSKAPDVKETMLSARDAPPSAPSSVQGSSGRGMLWALLVIGAVAGVTAYLYFTRPGATDGPGPRGSGSAAMLRPPGSGRPTGSATATATATSSASASADAGAPPAPPEDMVYVPPFNGKLGEGPTMRDVILPKGFYLDKHEVSAGAYHQCVTSGHCSPASEIHSILRLTEPADAGADGGPSDEAKQWEDVWKLRCNEPAGRADQPINCITYNQADQFCRSRGRRLPTEAEWEAAAQGTESRPYPWGSARPDCELACVDKNGECRGGDVAPCALGSHPHDKTPAGALDMGGNVAEWVYDGFTPKPPAGTEPKASPFSKVRVVRGGSFYHGVDMLRSSMRRDVPSGAAEAWIGVRCAMDVPSAP
jgi:serine/threonine-protein kinase